MQKHSFFSVAAKAGGARPGKYGIDANPAQARALEELCPQNEISGDLEPAFMEQPKNADSFTWTVFSFRSVMFVPHPTSSE
jgi:hypothetical protein